MFWYLWPLIDRFASGVSLAEPFSLSVGGGSWIQTWIMNWLHRAVDYVLHTLIFFIIRVQGEFENVAVVEKFELSKDEYSQE